MADRFEVPTPTTEEKKEITDHALEQLRILQSSDPEFDDFSIKEPDLYRMAHHIIDAAAGRYGSSYSDAAVAIANGASHRANICRDQASNPLIQDDDERVTGYSRQETEWENIQKRVTDINHRRSVK